MLNVFSESVNKLIFSTTHIQQELSFLNSKAHLIINLKIEMTFFMNLIFY